MRTREEQYNDSRFVKKMPYEIHAGTGAKICVYGEEKPTGLPDGSSQTITVYSGHWSTPNWNNEVKRYVSVDVMEEAILEAERRAEQRVREEMGKDSERLDWLLARTYYGIPGFDPCVRGRNPENRKAELIQAIDTAREVG